MNETPESTACGTAEDCFNRRVFLLRGGSALTLVPLVGLSGITPVHALQANYPRRLVEKLSELSLGVPIYFDFPSPGLGNLLVKLGVPAGGGVGPLQDVVAFSLRCTHLGGDLTGTFNARHPMLGPCPYHLTTFDLTRHGMVIAGHATESLPQIMLEVDSDALYAVGVMGLVYGNTGDFALAPNVQASPS